MPEIKLPFKHPIVDSYPNYAAVVGIVGAHTDQCLPWIYSYLEQLMTNKSPQLPNWVDYCAPISYLSFPWIDFCHIKRDCIENTESAIISLLQKQIENEIYPYLLADRFYLPYQTNSHDKNHYVHEILITGYNSASSVFYIYDHLEGKYGKYGEAVCSFCDIAKAYIRAHTSGTFDWLNGVVGLFYRTEYDFGCRRAKKDLQYEINIRMFKDLLADYLSSQSSNDRWCYPLSWMRDDELLFGLDVYDGLSGHAQRASEVSGEAVSEMEISGFYCLLEHKKLMRERLINFSGKRIIRNADGLIQENRSILRIAELLLIHVLKFNFSRQKDNSDHILELIMMLLTCLIVPDLTA